MSKARIATTEIFDAAPLSDEVLEAASSKGLLRRARRDIESGLVRLSARDGGTVLTEADGENVRLPGGPISAASCSCPASGLCRHILASIMFVREAEEMLPASAGEEAVPAAAADMQAEPTPAAAPFTHAEPVKTGPTEPVSVSVVRAEILGLADSVIVKIFGRAAHIRAQALLAALEPDTVRMASTGNALRIELGTHPAVLYLAGGGPAGMISKSATSERAVLHAAALLAVRGPGEATKGNEAAAVGAAGLPATSAADLLAETALLLRDAARQALSKAPAGLEERIADLTLTSRTESIPRLAAELRTIAAMIRRRRERLDAADPAELLSMLARSYALVQALKSRPSDPLLTGSGGETPQALGALDLVGCGLQLWQTDSGARGVTGYFISSEKQNFSATLARAAGSDPSFSSRGAATGEPVFGRSLAALAKAAFRFEDGSANSDGRLQSSRGRAAPEEKNWGAAIEAIDGAILGDWQQCAARLASPFMPKLTTPPRRAVPLVLRPARLGPLRFDEVAQVGRWPIGDGHGAWLELEIDGDDRMELKFALLGSLDPRKPPLIVVLAEARGADILLTPLGFGTDSLTVLDLPPVAGKLAEQTPSLLSRMTKGFSLPGLARRGSEAEKMRFEAMARPQAASMRLVSSALDGVLALAELGGRMEDPDRLQGLEQSGRAIEDAGLVFAGQMVASIASLRGAERADRMLRAAYILNLITRMEPRIPFVRPLSFGT